MMAPTWYFNSWPKLIDRPSESWPHLSPERPCKTGSACSNCTQHLQGGSQPLVRLTASWQFQCCGNTVPILNSSLICACCRCCVHAVKKRKKKKAVCMLGHRCYSRPCGHFWYSLLMLMDILSLSSDGLLHDHHWRQEYWKTWNVGSNLLLNLQLQNKATSWCNYIMRKVTSYSCLLG